VPVAAIRPATDDESIFLITLDLSGAPALVDAYTTPGQYLLTRVPSGDKRPPAYMCISSAPRSGFHFDLLLRSVTGTTSEQLCELHVGDVVELGPVTGPGFAIHNINPPAAAETVLLFAVGVGIRSMHL
jgi:ferredoxin-NADP reductase